MEHLPQDILQAEGVRAAGLAACREATAETVRVAAGEGSSTSSLPPLVFLLQNNNFSPDSFEQTFLDEARRLQRQELGILGIEEEKKEGEDQLSGDCGGGDENMSSRGVGGGGVLGGEESLDGKNNGDDARGNVFFVEDSVSLYGKLRCYEENSLSHYHEPVKLVEAKMLWDLFTLVDLEQSRPAAPSVTSQASEPDGTAVEMSVQLTVVGAAENHTASGSSRDDVWSRLLEATSSQDKCASPPCGKVSNVWVPTVCVSVCVRVLVGYPTRFHFIKSLCRHITEVKWP